MTEFYISYSIIDGKPKWVIVDKNGNITNRNPNKIELKNLEIFRGRNRLVPKVHYKDVELLEFLRKSEREKGRSPASRDFDNNPEYPGSSTYVRRFGSWNKALKMAGIVPIESRGYQYTNEELLEFLRKFERKNGRSPIEEDFNSNSEYPGPKTYQRRFGSWNKALKMAGLHINVFTNCTNEDLLGYLTKFYEEKGRPPVVEDFIGNHEYPSFRIYQYRFGGWQKALRLVELDVDSMVRKGIIETEQQKARQAEIHILENDEKGATDLSGENSGSFADGISRISKGQIYDVKSSKLHEKKYWSFNLDKCVDFYYLLAYDKEHKNLLYKWKVPGDFTDGIIVIGDNNHYTYNIENMKEFEIGL